MKAFQQLPQVQDVFFSPFEGVSTASLRAGWFSLSPSESVSTASLRPKVLNSKVFEYEEDDEGNIGGKLGKLYTYIEILRR